jgi:hypothetical protein
MKSRQIRGVFSDNSNNRDLCKIGTIAARHNRRGGTARIRSPINASFTIQHCVHHAPRMQRGE